MWLFHCWSSFECTGFHSESRCALNRICSPKGKYITIASFFSIEMEFDIKTMNSPSSKVWSGHSFCSGKESNAYSYRFLTLVWMIKKAFSWTEVATREGFYTLCSEYRNHREWRRKPCRSFISSFIVSLIFNGIFLLTNE